MELWDLYNASKEKTSKQIHRHEKHLMTSDDYHLVVCIIPINSQGQILIQKRSSNKAGWPNMWADTGGAAIAGEISVEAAIRELDEEVGIRVTEDEMHLLISQREVASKYNYFRDVYVVHRDFELDSCVLDEEEVSEVRWATIEEVKEMIDQHQFADLILNYMDCLENYMKENN